MTEEGVSQEFRLKKIKETNSYFIKEISQNELLSNKNKKGYTILNYIEHFLTLAFYFSLLLFYFFTFTFYFHFSLTLVFPFLLLLL